MKATFSGFLLGLCAVATIWGGEMRIGWAQVNLLPEINAEHPVQMTGLLIPRYTSTVESPLTATAMAIEVMDGDRVMDQAIFVSYDLGTFSFGFVEGPGPLVAVRQRLAGRVSGFDLNKLVTMATHCHTVPNFDAGRYDSLLPNSHKPADIYEGFLKGVVEVAEQAWKSRRPGTMTWGLGHAVLAKNRRVVYADGHAAMGGWRKDPNFDHVEGGSDHGVEMVFFWDLQDKLTGVLINAACPAQTNSQKLAITADYWDEVRARLRKHPDFAQAGILPMLGIAGDQWPTYHFIRENAEAIMRERRGLSHSQEYGRRLADAILDVYPYAQKERLRDVPFVHRVERMRLPYRRISEQDAAAAQAEYDRLDKDKANPFRATEMQKFSMILGRYRRQQQEGSLFTDVELHIMRLGDLAIATNPFELYHDYGVQIKARSPAILTLTAQLAGETGQYQAYLPTAQAERGRGFSAEVLWFSYVGSEGGRMLVNRTVDVIHELWK